MLKVLYLLKSWKYIEVYESMDPYSRSAITSLGLAYGLVDNPFTFTLYTIYTFLFTLKSRLTDTNYTIKYTNISLKLSFILLVKYGG